MLCTVIPHPLTPSRTILSSSPSLVLIHLIPCSWGSIIRGHLSALVRIVAFSMDMRSLGRFSLFHRATVAASVRRESTSSSSVMGMAGCWGVVCLYVCACTYRYKCVLFSHGPVYIHVYVCKFFVGEVHILRRLCHSHLET